MLLQRSKLAATAAERPRLAPPWAIALLCGAVVLALILVFPHRDLVRRIYEAPPSLITEAYLINLLRTDPNNPRLQMILARNQAQLGQSERMRETIAPVLEAQDPSLRREAAWMLWLTQAQHLEETAKDSPEYPPRRAELIATLRALGGEDWSQDRLGLLARKALSLGETELGFGLLDRVAGGNPAPEVDWYVGVAREALGFGEYQAAAQFYFRAAQRSEAKDQTRLFIEGLRVLQAGDRIPDALAAAEQEISTSPHLGEDRRVLTLLIEFARAARRPELADRYARRLLRLSLAEQWHFAQAQTQWQPAALRVVALEHTEAKGDPRLPFDDRAYTLGFEAFLDNRKNEDAWRVAASAVRQAPDSATWRERLARVSEWTGRPRLALEHWSWLARRTGREEAWQAVLRLAPGLFDDEALRPALLRELAKQPGDQARIRALVDLYERLGEPVATLAFLEEQYAALQQSWLIEQMATIAEAAGLDHQAVAYWHRLNSVQKLSSTQAVRLAVLLTLRGEGAAALDILRGNAPQAVAEDSVYWRLSAELARQEGDEAFAGESYRKLVATDQGSEEDFDALYALLEEKFPLEAARVAVSAWWRFQRPIDLGRALDRWVQTTAWSEAGRLLKALNPAQLQVLRQSAELLRLSAQYYLHTGAFESARREMERALMLAPEDAGTREAYLWMLIETGDGIALRRALLAHETRWAKDARLHDVLGVAYQYLSRPDIAIKRYFSARLEAKRGDLLWLMNFADALEQNSEIDRAWRMRQHMLAEERKRSGRREWLTAPEAREMRRIARARLAILQRQGDTGWNVLHELLRLDRDAEGRVGEHASVVATAWLQGQQAYSSERAWIWQQFAKTTSRPLWGEITVALIENDHQWVGHLLERHGERLPRYDRINAARRVDDLRLAQSDAFETQTDQPDDDPLHLQLSDALLDHSHALAVGAESRRIGTVDERELSGGFHLALTPRLTLDLKLASINRNNRDPAVIGVTPDEDFVLARLSWRHLDGITRLGIEAHRSFANYRPIHFEHEQRIDDRLRVNFAVGNQLPTSESAAMRVAGMRDRAALGLVYRPSLRDRVGVEHSWERYRMQTGTKVGSGTHLHLDYYHALRMERRDLEASAFWSMHRYQREGFIDDPALAPLTPAGDDSTVFEGGFFLPENFRYYGLRLSTDQRFAEEYTRAWRPYATVARTWNSATGSGYSMGAGIAGSVLGADHLRIGWSLERGGRETGGLVRQFGITYRLHD